MVNHGLVLGTRAMQRTFRTTLKARLSHSRARSVSGSRCVSTSEPETPAPRDLSKTQSEAAKFARPDWDVDRQLKDIIPGDLTATLEAHRKSNEETKFRWVAKRKDEEGQSEEATLKTGTQLERDKLDQEPRTKRDTPDVPAAAEVEVENGIHIGSIIRKTGSAKRAQHSDRQYGQYVSPFRLSDKGTKMFWPPFASPKITKASAIGLGEDNLSLDLRNISGFLTLNGQEATFRHLLAQQCIHRIPVDVEDVQLELVGSMNTGIATTTSDVDLAITIPSMAASVDVRGPSRSPGRPENRKIMQKKLRLLTKSVRALGFTRPTIIMARYPLLRATHTRSRVVFQFVFSSITGTQRTYVRRLLEEYVNLRVVYNILRAVLEARQLTDVSIGGLGSYPLIMMIAAAFRHKRVTRRDDAVTCLKAALNFYATLDTTTTSITFDPGVTYEKHRGEALKSKAKQKLEEEPWLEALHDMSLINPEQPWLLCFQDPDDIHNDLGRRSYRWREIQKTFGVLDDLLGRTMAGENVAGDQYANQPRLGFLFGHYLGTIQRKRGEFYDWLRQKRGQADFAHLQATYGAEDSTRAAGLNRDGDVYRVKLERQSTMEEDREITSQESATTSPPLTTSQSPPRRDRDLPLRRDPGLPPRRYPGLGYLK